MKLGWQKTRKRKTRKRSRPKGENAVSEIVFLHVQSRRCCWWNLFVKWWRWKKNWSRKMQCHNDIHPQLYPHTDVTRFQLLVSVLAKTRGLRWVSLQCGYSWGWSEVVKVFEVGIWCLGCLGGDESHLRGIRICYFSFVRGKKKQIDGRGLNLSGS